MDILLELGVALFLIVFAFFIGTIVEKAHYKEIQKREKALLFIPVVTSKYLEDLDQIQESQLVMGSVVISLDYFKRFLAGLRSFFGGRIKSYETLLDRGRREAILRMKENAQPFQPDLIMNMRLMTSNIFQVTNQPNAVGGVEIFAYGTAVKLKKT